MLKFILFGFSLLSSSLNVYATEHRFRAFDRFGEKVNWDHRFPDLMENATSGGELVMAQAKPIESIAPYTSKVADDLYYESLYMPDPTGRTERMYPRIASSVRVDDEGKYLVFELDPGARFQDNMPVTPSHVMWSAWTYRLQNKDYYDSIVASITEGKNEIRFDLKTTGQASRHALMWLAKMKIVKGAYGPVREIGGIPVNFIGSGPYRLLALGKNQMSFVRNPSYWGASLPSVRGLFHFNRVDVINFGDLNSARMSLAQNKANFFLEPHPLLAAPLADALINAKSAIDLEDEPAAKFQTRKRALVFNLSRVHDVKVRRALMLAYDFDGINQTLYGGKMQRPLHIAETSNVVTAAMPSREVAEVMESCSLPQDAFADFTGYGHSQFALTGDRRARLLKAQKLLLEAGYVLENGVMKLNGRPLIIRVLAPDLDQNALVIFRADLSKIGVGLYAGNRGENAKDFDLYSSDIEFVSNDGRPLVTQSLNYFLPLCLTKTLWTIHTESPYSETYKINAEAFARMSEALQLYIFTGGPIVHNYFLDHRFHVPDRLTRENIHLYGFYLHDRESEHTMVHPPMMGQICQEFGCLFGPVFRF